MKLLHTADWHLGRRLEGKSRHDEQVAVLKEICAIAESEDVDGVLVTGDIYDSYNPPAESEALFYTTAARLSDGGRRAVVVIAGNHDGPDRLRASDPYARALGIVTLGYPHDVAEPFDGGAGRVACLTSAPPYLRLRLRSGEHLSILALPYPSEARLRQVLSDRIGDAEAAESYDVAVRNLLASGVGDIAEAEACVAISHLFVCGGRESESERTIQGSEASIAIEDGVVVPLHVGGAYAVEPRSFPMRAGYVALGHLHRPQEFVGYGGPPIRYAGSPLAYSFSEAGQRKSVTIVEFEGPIATHRAVDLESGRTLIDKKGLRGLDELNAFLDAAPPDAWLAVAVELDAALPVGAIEEICRRHRGILRHIFHYAQESGDTPREPIAGLPIDEQFRRFVRERGEEPSPELIELFMEIASEGSRE